MKIKHLFALIVSLLTLCACDESTTSLGMDMMPSNDLVTQKFEIYDVATQSYAVGDSVLARTSTSYLGRFTDPETGTTVKSDFMSQFHCNEGFSFPDSVKGDSCTSIEVRLFIKGFVGDSLASFKLSVYDLNKDLDPEADYYTNINPEKFCDMTAEPLATKWFTINDRTIKDSLRWSSSYNNNIRIPLPQSVGTAMIQAYKRDRNTFASTASWLHSGLPSSKGLYFKLENGDGAMAYIDVAQMNIYFNYYDEDYKKDTLGICQFAATEEVVEATQFDNSNLDLLLNDTKATYLKSPAGIFTMATLPAEQLNVNDTINSAKLTFTRYNDKVDSPFKLSVPATVLLVRLDDYLNGFFENYKVSDGVTSYTTTFNRNSNSYVFGNVSRLLTQMLKEKNEGTATANWNKVLLIPVETSTNTQSQIVKLNHDFSMSSSRLVGGDDDRVKMEVIYSRFNK